MFYKVTYHIILSDNIGIRVTKHFTGYTELCDYENEVLSKFKGYVRCSVRTVTLD